MGCLPSRCSPVAQYLGEACNKEMELILSLTIYEKEVKVAIISELNRHNKSDPRVTGGTSKVAIRACGNQGFLEMMDLGSLSTGER